MNQSEITDFDPLSGPQISKPRFVDVSVRDAGSHWFRFQNAAKKPFSLILGMINEL